MVVAVVERIGHCRVVKERVNVQTVPHNNNVAVVER